MHPHPVCRVILLCACLAGLPAQAGEAVPVRVTLAPSKATQPVLSVAGRPFSLADLESLGMYRVTTRTFWPGNDGTYEGPLLADVLRRAGLYDAAGVRISALDGFSQVLPRQDWTRWPVLLATRRDGQPLSVRNKGPLRVIYPRDMSPELSDTLYRLRWVWLVNRIEPADPE